MKNFSKTYQLYGIQVYASRGHFPEPKRFRMKMGESKTKNSKPAFWNIPKNTILN